MKIALGTKSESKFEILSDFLLARYGFGNFEIISCDVSSGVAEQPLGEDVIFNGAKNRAIEALAFRVECDLGLGLEAGLIKSGSSDLALIGACAIFSHKSGLTICASDIKLVLPKEVTNEIGRGGYLGKLIRGYKQRCAIEETRLVDDIISRKVIFEDAINKSLNIYNKY